MAVEDGTTVDVWWSSLAAADRSLLDLLDAAERARVDALQRPADQGRSLVAAALLRVVVGARLGVPPAAVVIDRTCEDCGGPHGRPRVVAPAGVAPQVSVSHSGVLVVVASTPATPVGIDVQRRVGPQADPAPGDESVERPGTGSVEDWVRREAVLKVGRVDGPVAVRPLTPPRPGYAAALATATDAPATDAQLRVRHWPQGTGAGR